MIENILIIGAGHAGGQAAATLRSEGFTGRVILLGEEKWPPHERPPLSKALMMGQIPVERTFLRKDSFYAEKNIELRRECRVAALDREQRRVIIATGEAIAYDRLLIATGATPRPLTVPGSHLAGIHALRTIDDALAIKPALIADRRLVVVGGGYVGLELAAVAAKAGMAVTLVELADRVMARVAGEPIARFIEQEHRAHGVDIRLGEAVTGFEGESHVTAVVTRSGAILPADLVVVGIGVVANDGLARAAGLACDNGIVVDEQTRSSDPAIHAAGDVTNHPNGLFGGRYRLESVHNAVAQSQVAARAMLGRDVRYREVPWFWSDQYDVKIQSAGLHRPEDEMLVRGDPETRRFSVLYLRGGRLVAIDAVNNTGDFVQAKRLIADQALLPSGAADPAVPLSG